MKEMTLREADSADIPSLERLINTSYRGKESRKGWTNEADLLKGQRTDSEQLGALLDQPNSVIFLADYRSEVVGCVHLKKLNSGKAYLGMLAIAPNWQQRGIGRTVVSSAEAWLRANWSSSTVRMTVIQMRQELIAWYERCGYLRTGEVEPFPYGDPSAGAPLFADMEFIVLEKQI